MSADPNPPALSDRPGRPDQAATDTRTGTLDADPGGAASTAPLRTLLHEDWVAHGRSWVHPGLHALVVYRIGHWRLTAPRWLRLPVTVWYKFVNALLIRNVYGVEIGDEAVIGRRVRIGHHQCVHVPSFCVVGDDSVLRHNLTIGFTGPTASRDAVPKIGRRVSVGPGAYLLGPITIGDDATIGPAALVTTDVPAGATAFAAPARVMKYNP